MTSRNGVGAPLSKLERGGWHGVAEGMEMEMGKNLGDEEEFDESSLLSFFLSIFFLAKVDE